MPQPIIGEGGHLGLISDRHEKHKRGIEDINIFLPANFVEFCSAVAEEKSKMSRPIRDQGGKFVFPIAPKNIILMEDVEILLSDKFRLVR